MDESQEVDDVKLQEEIDGNYEAFTGRLDEYMPIHANKFALMRNREVVEFYNDWQDAWKTGRHFYPDGLFSIQKVTKTPVYLGIYSHALSVS